MKRYRCTEKVNCDQALEAMKDGVNIIELREKYAKREVFEEFINSMEYEKPYYLQLDKSVFTDGYSKHLAVDLEYREATQQEKDLERAVRFYEAFQGFVYRSREMEQSTFGQKPKSLREFMQQSEKFKKLDRQQEKLSKNFDSLEW